MIRIALKDLLGRKLRLVLTSLAIVMGVAMVSGTFVLTDTINAGFTTIFTTVCTELGRGRHRQGGLRRHARTPRRSPSRRSRRSSALPGVADAAGGVGDLAQFVGANGKVDLARRRTRPRRSASTRRRLRFNPLGALVGQVAARARRGRDRRATPPLSSTITVGDSGRRRRPRRQGAALHASAASRGSGARRRSAARRSRSSTFPPRRRSSARRASSTRSPSPRSPACRRPTLLARSGRCCRRTRRCGPASSRRSE